MFNSLLVKTCSLFYLISWLILQVYYPKDGKYTTDHLERVHCSGCDPFTGKIFIVSLEEVIILLLVFDQILHLTGISLEWDTG